MYGVPIYLKRFLWAAIFIAIFLIGTVFVAETYFPWEDKKRERIFNERVKNKIEAGEEKIYLRDLTDFEWDQVCYFKTQNGEGGMQYPTPSEVLGRKYNGYVPLQSCDTFGHNDFLFSNKTQAIFIRMHECILDNLCRTRSFSGQLHCCSRNSFLQKEVNTFSGKKNNIYVLNEDKSEGGEMGTPYN